MEKKINNMAFDKVKAEELAIAFKVLGKAIENTNDLLLDFSISLENANLKHFRSCDETDCVVHSIDLYGKCFKCGKKVASIK